MSPSKGTPNSVTSCPAPNGMTMHVTIATPSEISGARWYSPLLAAAGVTSSLRSQLDDVDDRLEETQRADPVWPEAVLDEGGAAPLDPHHDRHRGDHGEHDDDNLGGCDGEFSPHAGAP